MLHEASRLVVAELGKPERYVMVVLEAGAPVLFGGKAAPAAYLELKSIGLPHDRTRELSAALCRLMESSLHVPPDRVYIEFTSAAGPLWGWNGATF